MATRAPRGRRGRRRRARDRGAAASCSPTAAAAPVPTSRERDYGQTAIVARRRGRARAPRASAFERFTAEGPLALLPFADGAATRWCGRVRAERARALLARSRRRRSSRELQRAFRRPRWDASPRSRPRAALSARAALSPLDAPSRRAVVAIGNAAQTLHPVAGQGLNLGLRDAAELARDRARCRGRRTGRRRDARAPTPRARADRIASISLTDGLVRVFGTMPLARPRAARSRGARPRAAARRCSRAA